MNEMAERGSYVPNCLVCNRFFAVVDVAFVLDFLDASHQQQRGSENNENI
jgi:hypothetical protein